MNTFDLNDDLSDIFGDNKVTVSASIDRPVTPLVDMTNIHIETCKKCRGTGRFVSWAGRVVGNCHACKGAGKIAYKSRPEERLKARAQRTARIERAKTEAADMFAETHPDIAAWIKNNPNFEFAQSMGEAVRKWGSLTDGQMRAVKNCMAREAERKAQRENAISNAPTVNLEGITKAFNAALASGLRFPKLRLDTFTFSLASVNSKNAGATYVKEGETYLGKIVDGKFIRVRDCNDDQAERILTACADPAAAAAAYGRRTGACSCCGRTLTNKESIERAIGPICAAKFGW